VDEWAHDLTHEIDRSRADARGCGGGRADGEEKGRCLGFILFRSRDYILRQRKYDK
jgi:hypothetical protein